MAHSIYQDIHTFTFQKIIHQKLYVLHSQFPRANSQLLQQIKQKLLIVIFNCKSLFLEILLMKSLWDLDPERIFLDYVRCLREIVTWDHFKIESIGFECYGPLGQADFCSHSKLKRVCQEVSEETYFPFLFLLEPEMDTEFLPSYICGNREWF